jgi:hypothetical protein
LRQSYTSVVGKIFNHRIFAWQKDGHRILDSVRRLSFWDCRMTCYMLVPTQCNEADDNRKSDKINMRSVAWWDYYTPTLLTPRQAVAMGVIVLIQLAVVYLQGWTYTVNN